MIFSLLSLWLCQFRCYMSFRCGILFVIVLLMVVVVRRRISVVFVPPVTVAVMFCLDVSGG
ncbi:hypothetical protein HanRHA438_Chr09g0418981 [Helianthus annuus]|uniref:Uncharacterized protein n=1 Tax=Helianthus annuus TaxID=4232 RepID=A0A9K3I9G5_HELAN|nr:hypothetical protein HanXRQr2_Chr09g0406961 [Helianthus annuus]KAJ0527452.1 hypothetical protein HanHA300_Chr09g0334131 [Helianthus annuus]KAJ0536182.1 hypothetical protein HanIR_Chr09g0438731 [Helianthus annuus]KAJ0543861.1 hypothetical protein HanHA89_Chr09g0355201 [Helianthus annuus]KAJ0708914.1 hypothetical protein HanLR1_Chr09g0334501 [Helianthus annuus]